ncbi:MAG: rhodanese-like domain-containing protein [Sphingomonadaceae bacterium]|nr:rhodanese-like domain-containing protein [Sphingomonadaceae bacterium]MDW8323006.1 rhodanese-like domain-containing protein [Burkholderiales bacterium]
MQHIRPAQLADWLQRDVDERPLLLDVREPWEYARCHIAGAVLMPMHTLPARLHELPRERDIVVICHHGVRSFYAGRLLELNGFARVINLSGGVDAWAREVDPTMPTY